MCAFPKTQLRSGLRDGLLGVVLFFATPESRAFHGSSTLLGDMSLVEIDEGSPSFLQ
jgi:hypothetical protein